VLPEFIQTWEPSGSSCARPEIHRAKHIHLSQRAPDFSRRLFRDMEVDHRGLHALVTEKIPDRPYIDTVTQQRGRE